MAGKHLSLAAAAAVLVSPCVWAQSPGGGFAERARAALGEPYVGIKTNGRIEEDLFEITATGVSTEGVRRAAIAFLDALDAGQRARTTFPVDDTEWRNWANVHRFPREGVSIDEMTEGQRERAFALLESALSERGYETSRDIMRLNHHLAELVDNFDEYGEGLYYFTVMGEPSAQDPWGWQIDGHHLVINYFVLGDQVVMTPVFMGSEPISASSGTYAGTSIMGLEQSRAIELMRALDAEQRETATLSATKSRGENQAEMLRDNLDLDYEGLPATRLDAGQRQKLIDLIEVYVGNMDEGHAAVRMDEVLAHLDRTWFAWKGSAAADGVFYYRVHSPVIYIEFDHQGPVALAGPRDVATRDHVHSVVRTPNGNDYGKDLLRQHHERYANDPMHGHRDGTLVADGG